MAKFLRMMIFVALGALLVFPSFFYSPLAGKSECTCPQYRIGLAQTLNPDPGPSGLFQTFPTLQPRPNSVVIPPIEPPSRLRRTVVVAIIDSGVDLTNPTLRPFLWVNVNEDGTNQLDDDKNGFTDDRYGINALNSSIVPLDDNGHGTHVAGIITGNSDIQPSGSPAVSCRILSIKILDRFGSGTFEIAKRGLCFAIAFRRQTHLPVVINASWIFTGGEPDKSFKDLLKEAGSAGILVVAAAGNDHQNKPAYPAAYDMDNVISVGATDRRSLYLTGFSNLDADIAAPGDFISSTKRNGGTVVMSGTSMSAPLVTQAAVRLLQIRDYKPKDLKKIILNDLTDESKPLKDLVKKGRVLNIQKAMAYRP